MMGGAQADWHPPESLPTDPQAGMIARAAAGFGGAATSSEFDDVDALVPAAVRQAGNGETNRLPGTDGPDMNFAEREAQKASERDEVSREHVEYVNDLARREQNRAAGQIESTRTRAAISKRRTANLMAEMRSAFPDDLMSEDW
jgi:hypothetical protein